MPELPEVETLRKKLEEVLVDAKFSQVKILHPKSFHGDFHQIENVRICQVNRRAKILDFVFENNLHLITHLKMTGQLIYVSDNHRLGGGHPTADWVRDLPSTHTRIIYRLDDGSRLFFNDQRIFGWMKIVKNDTYSEMLAKLGPDVNDPNLTVDYLVKKLQRRTIPIKQAIMNNDIMCGIGNIYACDALNISRISPFKPAGSLSTGEVELLLDACRQVIDRGIELGGTTFDGKYVDTDGFAGGYQDELKVYGREGEACLNCGGTISKTKLGGRGTYYCAACQK